MVLLRVRPASSPSGAVVWRRTWDDPTDHPADYAGCLATDPAGNAIVAGTSYSSASDIDLVVIKWKANGRRAWVARYGSPYAMLDYPVDMACDGQGNVIVAGIRHLIGNDDADWVMAKFRARDGKRLWVRNWSGTEKPASDDRPAALVVDAAGYSYSVGYSDDASGVHDAIVMKRTPAGKLAWTRRVDRTMYGSDEAERIALAGGKLSSPEPLPTSGSGDSRRSSTAPAASHSGRAPGSCRVRSWVASRTSWSTGPATPSSPVRPSRVTGGMRSSRAGPRQDSCAGLTSLPRMHTRPPRPPRSW